MRRIWWVLGLLLVLPMHGDAQRHDLPQEDHGDSNRYSFRRRGLFCGHAQCRPCGPGQYAHDAGHSARPPQ